MNLLGALWEVIAEHSGESAAGVVAFLALCGTTVTAGWKGVVFHLGRPGRVLAPGFHLLVPVIQRVKKVRCRSVTLNAKAQRVTSADGHVYEADTNVVFRVEDPRLALVEVADFAHACHTVLSMAVCHVIAASPARLLADTRLLDQRLDTYLQPRLARWGLTVERAGFTSLSPSAMTLRLSQLEAATSERGRIHRLFVDAGMAPRSALKLLGSHSIPTSHSRLRYRSAPSRHARRPARVTPDVVGDAIAKIEAWADED